MSKRAWETRTNSPISLYSFGTSQSKHDSLRQWRRSKFKGGGLKNAAEWKREESCEIKLSRRERQIVSSLVCHLYDLSARDLVKLNSGVVWCRESRFPIMAEESHINKLHKHILHRKEGEFSPTVQWNLSGVLFMCVTVFTLSALPSLYNLGQLHSCHTTCLCQSVLIGNMCWLSVCARCSKMYQTLVEMFKF